MNLQPQSQVLTVQCGWDGKGRQIDVSPSEILFLRNRDPTEYTCNDTHIICNGKAIGKAVSQLISSEDCNAKGLLENGVVQPTSDGSSGRNSPDSQNSFACPNDCFDQYGSPGCGNNDDDSSIGVFQIRSRYTSETQSSVPTSKVKCSISDGLLNGEVILGTKVFEVVYPDVQEFQITIPATEEVILASETTGLSPRPPLFLKPYGATMHTFTNVTAFFGNELFACPFVRVGGFIVNSTCSDNNSNVNFITPSYEQICGNISDDSLQNNDCGYQKVEISLPDDTEGSTRGGTIECPGSCPLDGPGFFYTLACQGYEDPLLCQSLSNPPENCAFGGGDRCRKCDRNAICPGGFRMWPKEGYWTADEQVGSVHECPPPKTERCEGWDRENSRSRCRRGYQDRLCGLCSPGYYQRFDICEKCPDDATGAIQIGILLFSAFLLFLLVYSCVRFSKIYRGRKELKDLVRWQAKDFVIWTLVVLQLFSLVVVSSGANTPELKSVLVWIRIVGFEFEAVGPECFDGPGNVFIRHYAIFGTVLLALLGTLILNRHGPMGQFQFAKPFRGNLMTFLIFMYTPVTYLSVGITYCIEANSRDSSTVLVSWENPNVECAGEAHAPAMALGCVCFLFHSICFPIWSLWKIRTVYNANDKEHKILAKHYRKFFGDDFLPGFYWLLQIQMLLAFVLCCTRVYLSAYKDDIQQSKLTLNIVTLFGFGALLIYLKPYVRHMAWKLPVKISIVVLLILASSLEYLNYLYVDRQGVSREVVQGFSYTVFVVAVLNFIMLGIAFWFVVFREKDDDYYVEHFMLQSTIFT